jgi:septal ring factor EnvC (AmiA/AmiB activator)
MRSALGLRCQFTRLLSALTLAAALGTHPAEYNYDATERALTQVLDELNALNAWLDHTTKRLNRLQQEIATADKNIASISRRIHHINAELVLTQTSLLQLAGERKNLESLRLKQANRIARHIREAYRLSGQDFFKLLLNQESPDTIDRMIRYHGYFRRARLSALEEYQRTLIALGANERSTTDRGRQLANQQEDVARQKKLVGIGIQEREKLITQLRAEVGGKTELRNKLETDRRRLENLLAEIGRLGQPMQKTRFAESKGRLPWPIAGKLLHHYGQPKAGGRLTWEGMYFEAPAGSAVTAIHSGRVAFADWLRGFGLLTIINHGDQHMSLYGNANVLLKNAGDWVESGEPIASAGKSGGQPESGLYFEVRTKGRPTNPIAWLGNDRPQ